MSAHYVFVDESGDPGKPFITGPDGKRIPTGASRYYILSAVCLTPELLNSLQHRVSEVKYSNGYTKEIKSGDVSLGLYAQLLEVLNELQITTYYRLIDKAEYKGNFAIHGNKQLNNIFDEYNLVRVVSHAIKECGLEGVEVVIDRTDRRMHDGTFDNFNEYLKRKSNTKTIERVKYITHVSSDYVNAMQMSDLVCGAIRDNFTGRNPELVDVIKSSLLIRVI